MNAPRKRRAMCEADPGKRGGIDLNAVAHEEYRLTTATLTQLVLEHDELRRWLNLPYAETWRDQHAEKSARIRAVWQEIKRRFPRYAANELERNGV